MVYESQTVRVIENENVTSHYTKTMLHRSLLLRLSSFEVQSVRKNYHSSFAQCIISENFQTSAFLISSRCVRIFPWDSSLTFVFSSSCSCCGHICSHRIWYCGFILLCNQLLG